MSFDPSQTFKKRMVLRTVKSMPVSVVGKNQSAFFEFQPSYIFRPKIVARKLIPNPTPNSYTSVVIVTPRGCLIGQFSDTDIADPEPFTNALANFKHRYNFHKSHLRKWRGVREVPRAFIHYPVDEDGSSLHPWQGTILAQKIHGLTGVVPVMVPRRLSLIPPYANFVSYSRSEPAVIHDAVADTILIENHPDKVSEPPKVFIGGVRR